MKPEVGKAVCGYCWRRMEPSEYRAAYNKEENLNVIVCPECFEKEENKEK